MGFARKNLCQLRGKGITVPFQDALLATLAMQNDLAVWTYDKHFKLIAEEFPLLHLFNA